MLVKYLFVPQISNEESDLIVIEGFAYIKHVDSVTFVQQTLHKMLTQEPTSSHHSTSLVLHNYIV